MATIAPTSEKASPVEFQTHPDQYRHWRFTIEAEVATLVMAVQPDGGQRPGYELKLNSYDLGVDIELADVIQRLRFEHPEVRVVVITGGLDRVFCAGANIEMLGSSTHSFKVNFCRYTNETRLYIEDASEHSDIRFLAALNGTASGGGYELALACDRILLVDDRSSAVSFPELPLLAVLPGTGGLTRIAEKRKIRRDRNDAFSTIAEGLKGRRAVEWGFVDALAPLSKWDQVVTQHAAELAAEVAVEERTGIELPTISPQSRDEESDATHYRHLHTSYNATAHTGAFELRLPGDPGPTDAGAAHALGASWWIFEAFRELDLALLDLRLNRPEVALVTLRVTGDPAVAMTTDSVLGDDGHWFTREVRHFVKRVLKRLENTARSFYAVIDEGTAFAGTTLELALASDRIYLLDDPDVTVQLGISPLNGGPLPMANGLTRLETRFLATPDAVGAVLEHSGQILNAETAVELGLSTFAPDGIDWDDELRLAIEERVVFSPDALTGMEHNLRVPGPETLETRIFGRLSSWQNWIFQRPNAVGENGALKCYGTPKRPVFDRNRT